MVDRAHACAVAVSVLIVAVDAAQAMHVDATSTCGLIPAPCEDDLPFTWQHINPWGAVALVVALIAIAIRDRSPMAAFVMSLPALTFSAIVPAALTLYALARSGRVRPHISIMCSGLLLVLNISIAYGELIPWWESWMWEDLQTSLDYLNNIIVSGGYALTPVALGLLVRSRSELRDLIDETSRSRERESSLRVEAALGRERARLAREMHDIVSHQVSLIAVQAGALQVSLIEPAHKDRVRNIHKLCRQTLDELRQMLGILRASGAGPTDRSPQPRLADIPALVSASELSVELTIRVHDLPTTVERAIYRTVQEGLTNVRKHAPGATVSVDISKCGSTIEAKVTNSAPTEIPDDYPSSRHGLRGLADRAEILGGALTARSTPDGGFLLCLSAPARPTEGAIRQE